MVIEGLDELYRDVILEHFKSSTHAGQLPDAQIKSEGSNPLCGDELTFYLGLDGDQITTARFAAKGCAISQSAASMLAQQMEGRSIKDVTQIIEAMKGLMQGRELPEGVDVGDLEALSGVRKFPVRVKCAALAWNTVEQGLSGYRVG